MSELRHHLRRAQCGVSLLGLKGHQKISPARKVAEQARKRGQKVFLMFEDRRVTYAEFDRQVTRYARAMAALGLKKGDVAAVVMENRPEYLYAVYGLNRIGVTSALINTNLVGKPLIHVLNSSNMKALVVGPECLDNVQAVMSELDLPADKILVERTEQKDAPMPAGAQDLLAVADAPGDPLAGRELNPGTGDDYFVYIYTSGTTGLPKAGRFPNVRFFAGAYGIGGFGVACSSDDVIYTCLPLYHASAFVLGVSFALVHGGQLALARKFSASRFWDDVRRYEATVCVYIGEICRYIMAQPPRQDDRLHKVRAFTGNGMRPEIWRQLVDRHGVSKVHEFYAATEGNANMVNIDGHIGAVGQMNPITRLAYNVALVKWDPETEQPIRDARGFCIPTDDNEPGELLGKINPKKVSARFDGYVDPEATKKKIAADVFEKGDAYFRTGDLLKRDENGYFYFVDRIGDTFRWKGENVSTNEVADVLTGHPQIEVANVYGVTMPNAEGRAGMAAITTADNNEPDWASIFEYVRQNLPEYAQPLFLRWQQEQHLTGTFKLRKVELQKEGYDISQVSDPVYFRDTEEGAYVPVRESLYAKVMSGGVRV